MLGIVAYDILYRHIGIPRVDIYLTRIIVNVQHKLFVICLVILALVDKSLLKHQIEHGITPLAVFLRVCYRIVPRGVFGYRSNCGTLYQCKLAHILIEILVCRSLYAVASGAEIYNIEIQLKYLFLLHLLFKVERPKYLLYLTLYFV